MILVIIYPFTKRFFILPQLILGLAFSMAIPIVYASARVAIGFDTIILIFINTLWTLSYDTIYAMVDKKDDLKLKLNSAAILFGKKAIVILNFLNIVFHGCWLLLPINYYVWLLAAIFLCYLQYLVSYKKKFFKAFKLHAIYGLIMSFALGY